MKYIFYFLLKIPVIRYVVLVFLIFYLFILGFQYSMISLRTRKLEDIELEQYTILTRGVINKSLPKTNKFFGLYRLAIGILGFVFMCVPLYIIAVELSKL